MDTEQCDVAIIGAGPAGAVAAAMLVRAGFEVRVLEKQHFPRFVVGESLLPYAMEILEQAGMLPLVQAAQGFQYKNGMAFSWDGRYAAYDFTAKYGPGPGTAFNVQRDRFDDLLIRAAAAQGAVVCFGEHVDALDNSGSGVRLRVLREDGSHYRVDARFVLDASGHYRALPRLLGWEQPAGVPLRQVHFTHIDDHITDPAFDRNKNLVAIHPQHRDVWLWLIPFSNGRTSIGVVGEAERFGDVRASAAILRRCVAEMPDVARILAQAQWDNDVPFFYLPGYSSAVQSVHGRHFALLGNAAGFLDPVFSSGITIAVHSAKLAVSVLIRQLNGAAVDWQRDYAVPLAQGVNVFHAYVNAWYEGRFQDLLFRPHAGEDARNMISAVLAGYVWDSDNPYVTDAQMLLM
ncbi:flavin-dependent dehydrogenase [Neisseria sp. HSC-16F19]|nr:FAD-dependent oxidoreductase [Neisseria sp. HSC-16F19]MCP2040157.1 flavin-dependent dehydrogenase [Neisseria sp. HSC-16F19]